MRWLPPAVMAVAALVIGYCGFRIQSHALGSPMSWRDIIYRVVQLFFLNAGDLRPPLPWQLDLARFLAPAVSAYAAFLAVLMVFRDRLLQTRLVRYRDHVVVCGLGAKGLHLAERIQASGRKVVVIESDPDNGNLSVCRSRGMVVLLGNAADAGLLHRARVERASHLFAFCGEDERNADIAVIAERVAEGRKKSALTCVVHIRDIRLCRHLREKELIARLSSRFKIEYINVYETGARIVLEAHPAFDKDESRTDSPPHVLIAGLGLLGENLVMRIIGDWRHSRRDGRIRITVVDGRATAWRLSLLKRYPQLGRYCRIETVPAAGGGAGFGIDFGIMDADLSDVSAAYVCQDDSSDGVSTAIALHRHLRERGRRVPIIVPMREDGGLTRLLPGPGDDEGSFGNITAFGLFARCLTADLLDNDMFVVIARAIHEEYRGHRAMTGNVDLTDPSMKPWSALNAKLRKSNIDQTVHISERLRTFGYDIVPLSDWEAEYRTFPGDDVEGMAEMEHERWVRDKTADGFTYAPGLKTDKTNPCLVPWADLPEEERDKDRQAVCAAPRVLARAGFQVVRIGEGAGR